MTVNPDYAPISLGMGEPKHPTPAFIEQALVDNIHGLASYPTTIGSEALRGAIAGCWNAATASPSAILPRKSCP